MLEHYTQQKPTKLTEFVKWSHSYCSAEGRKEVKWVPRNFDSMNTLHRGHFHMQWKETLWSIFYSLRRMNSLSALKLKRQLRLCWWNGEKRILKILFDNELNNELVNKRTKRQNKSNAAFKMLDCGFMRLLQIGFCQSTTDADKHRTFRWLQQTHFIQSKHSNQYSVYRVWYKKAFSLFFQVIHLINVWIDLGL